MPICPNCENEYVQGVTVCPDCGIQLMDTDEFKSHLVTPEDWQEIYTTGSTIEAEMLKANLEGAGIEALIMPKSDRNFPAAGDLTVVKVFVKNQDADSARQIIDDINSSNGPEENQ